MPYSTKTLIAAEGFEAVHDGRLSVGLTDGGFTFAVVDADSRLMLFGEAEGGHAASMTEATRDIKALLAEVGIRPLAFRHMEMTVMSDDSAWVPDEVFTPAAARSYLRLVGGEGRSVMTAPCRSLASTAVFEADEGLVTAFKVAMPGLTVANQHVRMAGCASLCASHPVLLAHWRQGRVDLAAMVGGRYVYGNTLRFADRNTLGYLLLEVVRHFGLEGTDTELMMCGDVDRALFALLRPYFPTTTLFTGRCTAGPAFRQLHTYRHALLLL